MKPRKDLRPEKWTTQLRKGVLELCVLNVIATGRLYGYEIAKRLSALSEPTVREGTVYPILSRLKQEGLLEATIEASSEGPPRKYFALTAHGRRRLRHMNAAWDLLDDNLKTLRRRTAP